MDEVELVNAEEYRDVTEQLIALTDAITLLTRCMSSSHKDATLNTDLDQLLKHWKLEQTGFPSLYNACSQLKENLHLTTIEADKVVDDIQALSQLLAEEKRAGLKMKKIIQKVCKENRDLRKQNSSLLSQLKRCKAENKIMAQSLRGRIPSAATPDLMIPKGKINFDNSAETVMSFCESNYLESGLPESKIAHVEEALVPISPANSCISFVTDEGCASLRLSTKQRSIFSIFKNVRTSSSPKNSESMHEANFTNETPGL
jgi:hypothetical protein